MAYFLAATFTFSNNLVHTPKLKENFTCRHCEYSTPSKLGFVGHIGIRYKEVSQSPAIFRRTFYRKQFDFKVRLRDHTKLDFTMEELLKCTLCD